MHGVIRGGVEEVAKRGNHEPAGVKFVAGVPDDVEGDLPGHKEAEGEGVHGDQQDRHGENRRLDDGLGRRKGVGGPRARDCSER